MFEIKLSRAIIRPFYTIMLAIGAVIGVASLIIIISLFNNYYLASEKIFMGIHPHIKLQKEGMTMAEGQKTIEKLKAKFPNIAMITPAIYARVKAIVSKVNKEKAFCIKENGGYVPLDKTKVYPPGTEEKTETRYGFRITDKVTKTILLKGITVKNNETASGIKRIITGLAQLDDLNVTKDENNNPLPWYFYMQRDLFLGSVVLEDFLINFPGIDENEHIHLMQKGSLNMGTRKGAYPLLVMSLKNVQACLHMGNTFNTIEIKLNDPYKSENLSGRIAQFLGKEYDVKTWVQHSKAPFAFLKMIRIMIFLIIFSISVVAAIGVISTLTLIVMQNRGKISILKALGIKAKSIYRVFIINTLGIGIIGTILGTLLGYGASNLLIRFFRDNLKKLGIVNPAIQITANDLLMITVFVLALFVVTAIIPSRRAIEIDVVDGLQNQ